MADLSSIRMRVGILVAIVAVAVSVAGAAFWRAAEEERRSQIPTQATKKDQTYDLGSVLNEPHIVFRSTAPGPTYGTLAAVPLAQPGGGRSVSTLQCDRVYASGTGGLCLAADRGAVTTYSGNVLDAALRPVASLPVNGAPSRARLSADGGLAATTVFVSGHGYGSIGFSTETTITAGNATKNYGNLEETFRTIIDGKPSTAADLNIWGVTFAPGPAPDTFYATVATGGRTWLARGSLSRRTLTAIRQDAECPSLSPDGKRIVYKKRAGSPIAWRYHVLDLTTGQETPLGEKRSVDDQAEWLDDTHVLYGLQRAGTGTSDVWVADVTVETQPEVLIQNAWSPSVVRSSG